MLRKGGQGSAAIRRFWFDSPTDDAWLPNNIPATNMPSPDIIDYTLRNSSRKGFSVEEDCTSAVHSEQAVREHIKTLGECREPREPVSSASQSA